MADELILTINPTKVAVEPGGSAQLALQVQNHGAVVDEFEVKVLGDAAAWATVEQPQVAVFPEHTESVQVALRPPRAAYPAAGTIPVGFRVSSKVDPARTAVEECQVEVRPFVQIAGEVTPKTARGRFAATHRLRVINQGNAEVSVAVRAEVQSGDCQVSVPEGPLAVGHGQATTTKIRVRPSESHWQGPDELHSYRLSLEPQGGTPVALQASMRQRPILRVPIAMVAAAVLLVGGGLAIYGRGGNPIQAALRWTGVAETSPSSQPTSDTAPQSTPAPATSNATPPTGSTPTPAALASPTPSGGPILKVGPPINPCVLTALTSVTLTDAISGTNHILTWKGNAGCGPFTGTIAATYGFISTILQRCILPTNPTTSYSVTGASGTYTDTRLACARSYTMTLKDGAGNTATATAP